MNNTTATAFKNATAPTHKTLPLLAGLPAAAPATFKPSGGLVTPYLPAIPTQAAAKPYTGAQLLGEECAIHGTDLAYVDDQRPYAVTADGQQLNACAPACAPACGQHTDREINERVAQQHPHMKPITDRPTSVCVYDGTPSVTVRTGQLGNRYGMCADCSQYTKSQNAAEYAVRQAIHAENDGLTTHPRTTADALHRAIDDQSARHLAKVGGHTIERARGAEAFSTAVYAMGEALKLTPDREMTVRALRTALEMAIKESGHAPRTVTIVVSCDARRPGTEGRVWNDDDPDLTDSLPCCVDAGHTGDHRDVLGKTWTAR